jgi:hypothetical protein
MQDVVVPQIRGLANGVIAKETRELEAAKSERKMECFESAIAEVRNYQALCRRYDHRKLLEELRAYAVSLV